MLQSPVDFFAFANTGEKENSATRLQTALQNEQRRKNVKPVEISPMRHSRLY